MKLQLSNLRKITFHFSYKSTSTTQAIQLFFELCIHADKFNLIQLRVFLSVNLKHIALVNIEIEILHSRALLCCVVIILCGFRAPNCISSALLFIITLVFVLFLNYIKRIDFIDDWLITLIVKFKRKTLQTNAQRSSASFLLYSTSSNS